MIGKNHEEIKFHVSAKNGKNSLRFETLNAAGLAGEQVQGLIGKFLIPDAYAISKEGLITIHGKQISDLKGMA